MRVVGIGNRQRGDDAAGPAVADRLGGVAEVRTVEGDAFALLDAWAGASRAVVVDASGPGARPGTIRRFDAAARPLPARALRSSTHVAGVAEAIELARALGILPPHLEVYAIEGARFDLGDPVSPAVARAVERLAVVLEPACRTAPGARGAPAARAGDLRIRRAAGAPRVDP